MSLVHEMGLKEKIKSRPVTKRVVIGILILIALLGAFVVLRLVPAESREVSKTIPGYLQGAEGSEAVQIHIEGKFLDFLMKYNSFEGTITVQTPEGKALSNWQLYAFNRSESTADYPSKLTSGVYYSVSDKYYPDLYFLNGFLENGEEKTPCRIYFTGDFQRVLIDLVEKDENSAYIVGAQAPDVDLEIFYDTVQGIAQGLSK